MPTSAAHLFSQRHDGALGAGGHAGVPHEQPWLPAHTWDKGSRQCVLGKGSRPGAHSTTH